MSLITKKKKMKAAGFRLFFHCVVKYPVFWRFETIDENFGCFRELNRARKRQK